MTIDATAGGASANSYVTTAEADTYFGTSYNRTLWADAITATKETLLIEASRLLDTLVQWNGYLATNTQVLSWPRSYVQNPDSYPAHRSYMDSSLGGPYLSSTTIPKPIKEIAYELAYDILAKSGFQSAESELTKVKLGTLSVDFSERVKSQGFPQIVRDMITRWGEYAVHSSNNVSSVELVRV